MCVCVYAMYVCVRKHLPLSMHFHMRTYAYICKYVNDTTLPMCRSPRQMDRRTGRHRLCTQTHRQKDTQKHAQRDKDRQRNTHTHTYRETPQISALKFRGTWSCALLNGLDAAGHLEEVPSLVCFPVNPYS